MRSVAMYFNRTGHGFSWLGQRLQGDGERLRLQSLLKPSRLHVALFLASAHVIKSQATSRSAEVECVQCHENALPALACFISHSKAQTPELEHALLLTCNPQLSVAHRFGIFLFHACLLASVSRPFCVCLLAPGIHWTNSVWRVGQGCVIPLSASVRAISVFLVFCVGLQFQTLELSLYLHHSLLIYLLSIQSLSTFYDACVNTCIFLPCLSQAFTRWANSVLSKRGLKLESLFTSLSDGILLIQLLEILSGESLGKYDRNPKIKLQRCGNIRLALDYLAKHGVKLVNIGAPGELWCSGLYYSFLPPISCSVHLLCHL